MQLVHVQALYILRKNQHRLPRNLLANLNRRAQTLIREGRRHANVDQRNIRAVSEHRIRERRPIIHGGNNLKTVAGKQVLKPLPEQKLVFGYDDAHPPSDATLRKKVVPAPMTEPALR